MWDGETFLIYSEPQTHKLRHLERNQRLALHLNSDADGEDVVVFTGEAVVDRSAPSADQMPAYLEKYRKAMASIELTPEEFGRQYSEPIRVRPSTLRGF